MEDIKPTFDKRGRKVEPYYWALMVVSFGFTYLAFTSAINNEFVNWDDPFYVLNNPHIRDLNLETIKWMIVNTYAGFWMPLTWLSFALDYRLSGLDPQVYHFHNMILHSMNAILVYIMGFKLFTIVGERQGEGAERRMDHISPIWPAFISSVLFAIHPLRVESVVWVTERKDVLCGLFYLAGLLVYLSYASSASRKLWKLASVIVLFILALASKSMAMTFPLALILLDAWPLGRFKVGMAKVLLEKIPFVLITLFAGVMTVISQHKVGALSGLSDMPLAYRVMNAFHSLAFYLGKMFIPVELTTLYPIVFKRAFSPAYIGAVLLVLGLFVAAIAIRRKYPAVIVALLFYTMTLAPVLGIVQVGSQAAADRFTYLPSLAPTLLFSGALVWLMRRYRILLTVLLLCMTALLVYRTDRQIAVWRNSITLWEHTLKTIPKNSSVAFANLGDAYMEAGRLKDARVAFELAIRKGPPMSTFYDGRGELLMMEDAVDLAIEDFKYAASLDAGSALPLRHLAEAYMKKGDIEKALVYLQKAIELDPTNSTALYILGKIHGNLGGYDQAIESFKTALSMEPYGYKGKYLRGLTEAIQAKVSASPKRKLTKR